MNANIEHESVTSNRSAVVSFEERVPLEYEAFEKLARQLVNTPKPTREATA